MLRDLKKQNKHGDIKIDLFNSSKYSTTKFMMNKTNNLLTMSNNQQTN